MLPIEIAKIDEVLLTAICRERWPESQTLDFKRLLPANDEKGKQEFLKDVCAFANAGGGDLMYGVQEKPAGQADQIIPIPVATHGVWMGLSDTSRNSLMVESSHASLEL